MNNLTKDFIFALVVTAFIVAIPLTYNAGEAETSGLAMQQVKQEKVTPHIELISPDKRTKTYNAVQTFAYRLNSVPDPSDCSLMINGFVYDTKTLQPERMGQFKAQLRPDHYTWSVKCELLNGRTISSQEWSLRVDDPENFGEAFKQQNQVTGNVVAEDTTPARTTDTRGVMIAMLAIGALIWMLNFRKNS